MLLKALVNDKRDNSTTFTAHSEPGPSRPREADDIGLLLRGQYDIALLTYKKFSAIAFTHPYVLDQAGRPDSQDVAFAELHLPRRLPVVIARCN